MKITHYICPRSCGKTTKAKELQMEDPENTLLFLLDKRGNSLNIGQSLRGFRYKRIIIDEFLYICSQKSEITLRRLNDWILNEIIGSLELNGELVLLSTSDKLYDPIIFAMLCDQCDIRSSFLTGKMANFYVKEKHLHHAKEQLDEMRMKFLDPNMVDLKITNFYNDIQKLYRDVYELDTERYKTQILGEFLKY